MKYTKLLGILFTLTLVNTAQAVKNPIDIDFYAGRLAYENLYSELTKQPGAFISPLSNRDMSEIVELGRRNLKWLDHLNQFRRSPLRFTSKETQGASPIDQPKKYGPKTIFPDFENLKATLPIELYKVLFTKFELPNSLPTSDKAYIHWGRQINRLYQTSVRWLTLSRWLPWYKQNRQNDIRGYYFLSQYENLESKLKNWASLEGHEKQILSPLLINLCESGNSSWSRCPREFKNSQSNVKSFFNRHIQKAKRAYDINFKLNVKRMDLSWNHSNLASLPFREPKTKAIKDFLKINIEDEWRLHDWKLTLNFSTSASVRAIFKPNVTPNVNGLGGNIITMNSLNSLDDYNTQWTIRHEFGHVLGFPDCYVEFYDEHQQLMINYQIDVNNLMCSRRGRLLITHLEELKRVYQQE